MRINWALLLFIVVITCLFYTVFSAEKTVENTIGSDGIGYYSYLPKFFVEGNLDYSEYEVNNFVVDSEFGKLNKYFVGPAVLILPFFLFSLVFASLFDFPLDGYTFPFQMGVIIAGLFYLNVGLWFINKFLQTYNFKKREIFISLFALVFGTNLFYYSALHPSMSHVYSFSLISILIYAIRKLFITADKKYIYWSSLLLGLIFIVRPTNAIFSMALIPFLLEGSGGYKLRLSWKEIIYASTIFLIPLSIQLLNWKAQTGSYLVWNYQNEGFYFDNPEFVNFLFSFNKGWFVYTPLALLSFFSFVPIFKRNRREGLFLLFFYLFLIYVTSSWWNWFYGTSFGSRPMVDFYPVLAFLLISLISYTKKKYLPVLITLIGLFISLNLFQHYQSIAKILPTWNMTYDKYLAIWGVTEPSQVILGGNSDLPAYKPRNIVLLEREYVRFDKQSFGTSYDESKKKVVLDYEGLEYNFLLRDTLDERALTPKGLYLELEFERYEKELGSSTHSKVIVELSDSTSKKHYYYWFNLNESPANKLGWKKYNYQLRIQYARTNRDVFSLYIRNPEKKGFLLDNIKVKLMAQ